MVEQQGGTQKMKTKEKVDRGGEAVKEQADLNQEHDEVTETEVEEIIEVVESEVDLLKAALQEEENKRLRLLADYDNFKRRATLDKDALQKYKSQTVMTNLLPILDNFARALTVESTNDETRSLMEGMEMIYRSLADALKSEGLVEIESVDQEFDPNFHQAIMTDNVEDKPSGIVLEEMQKGYILKDRVLRPSMVKVNE